MRPITGSFTKYLSISTTKPSLLVLLPPPSPLFLRVGWPFLSLPRLSKGPSLLYRAPHHSLSFLFLGGGHSVLVMGLPLVKGVRSGVTCAQRLATWGVEALQCHH
ncbi:hypothetical protein V8E53_006666 [Lactarius tabidus]